ncbi:MAG: ribokinase [Armatimonadota bacterium]
MREIHVVGSCNMDLVMQVAELPAPGHTVLGGSFHHVSGGKGANQAVAARRAGGSVVLHAALGMDAYGNELFHLYEADGIDCSHILRDAHHPTGTAVILVDRRGENLIAVASGANLSVMPPTFVSNAGVFLVQGEVSPETIYGTIDLAVDACIPVILNNAPVVEIPESRRASVDILIVNEHEAGMMTNAEVTNRATAESAISLLRDQGYPCVIVTLGAEGVVCSHGDEMLFQPAFHVNPVDTTAAGDTFCGAFAARYVSGDSLATAIAYASAAAACSTLKFGAQSSIPDVAQTDEFLASKPALRS